ncbi:MAG: hypothetical protein PHT40_01380 [Patescibacteria group bacterium]|nr:hypothetical protein [Patescibacteria group bacterium]
MNWKQFLKPTKGKFLIFLIILILANIPFIGTTVPFKNSCICESPEAVGLPACNPLDYCYNTFEARSIFWWPGEISAPTGFTLLSYTRYNNTYGPIINSHSIPLLHILKWPDLYLVGLIINLIYFYIISCVIIHIYNRKKHKK